MLQILHFTGLDFHTAIAIVLWFIILCIFQIVANRIGKFIGFRNPRFFSLLATLAFFLATHNLRYH